MLDKLDLAQVGEHAEQWEKVVRKLRAGMMPPAGMPRPERRSLRGLDGGARKRAGPRSRGQSAPCPPRAFIA